MWSVHASDGSGSCIHLSCLVLPAHTGLCADTAQQRSAHVSCSSLMHAPARDQRAQQSWFLGSIGEGCPHYIKKKHISFCSRSSAHLQAVSRIADQHGAAGVLREEPTPRLLLGLSVPTGAHRPGAPVIRLQPRSLLCQLASVSPQCWAQSDDSFRARSKNPCLLCQLACLRPECGGP